MARVGRPTASRPPTSCAAEQCTPPRHRELRCPPNNINISNDSLGCSFENLGRSCRNGVDTLGSVFSAATGIPSETTIVPTTSTRRSHTHGPTRVATCPLAPALALSLRHIPATRGSRTHLLLSPARPLHCVCTTQKRSCTRPHSPPRTRRRALESTSQHSGVRNVPVRQICSPSCP